MILLNHGWSINCADFDRANIAVLLWQRQYTTRFFRRWTTLAHQVAPLLLPALNNCSMVHDKQVVVNGCIASYLSNGEKHLICPKLWLVYTSYSAVRD
jgi:hypothetical protein